MKIFNVFIIVLLVTGCSSQSKHDNSKEISREARMNDLEMLQHGDWTPAQTSIAAGFYRQTHYDEPHEAEIKIIEERAKKKDLNAMYAKTAQIWSNFDEPMTYEKHLKIYQTYYDLAKAGQINAKVKIPELYNKDEFYNGSDETSFEMLKKISNLSNQELQKLIDSYYVETIGAGYRDNLQEYIAFIINNKLPVTVDDSFSLESYYQNLRQVKALKDPKTAKEFSNILERTFSQNNDGNLVLFLMQINAFGIGKPIDLNKVCDFSKRIIGTEYSQDNLYKEILQTLKNKNINCSDKVKPAELDQATLNDWYGQGWMGGKQ